MKPGIGALVGLVVALTAAPALAQSSTDITLTAMGGVNFSKLATSGGGGVLRGGATGTTGSRTGWALGASVRVPLTERFSLQPEAYYAKRGGKDPNAEHSWSNVDLPVLINVGLAQMNSARIFGLVGAQVSARARAYVKVGTAASTPVTQQVVGGDVGLVVGAGAEVMGFSVQGRFVEGLTDSITSVGHLPAAFGPGKVRNRQIVVLFGYKLFNFAR